MPDAHQRAYDEAEYVRVQTEAIPEGSVVVERARVERLRGAIEAALRRYDNPREPHNARGGVPRGELAWAMMTDLRDTLQSGDLDDLP